mmetsp:Transcript_7721/g.11686  ORF Transcript_7721/g.11686 Transcript_7721/m.11686 type:complete len:182 (+) Transcript_7721:59-604(+)
MNDDFVLIREYNKQKDMAQIREMVIEHHNFNTKHYLNTPNGRNAQAQSIANAMKNDLAELEKGQGKTYTGRGAFLVMTLASDDNILVGCIGLEEHSNPDRLELRRVTIREKYHRKGLGRKLIKAVEEHAKKVKIDRLELETFSAFTAACGFYNACGFKMKNVSTCQSKVYGDAIIYEKKLK